MIPRDIVESSRTTATEQILERLKGDFKDVEYRQSYAEADLATRVAMQIRRLREDRGWTQKELAEKAGTKQSAISKLEDPGYGRYSLSLLQKLANVFDVALDVVFVPFSTAARKAVAGTDDLSVPSFHQDPFFEPAKLWTPNVANVLPFDSRRRSTWKRRSLVSTSSESYV